MKQEELLYCTGIVKLFWCGDSSTVMVSHGASVVVLLTQQTRVYL